MNVPKAKGSRAESFPFPPPFMATHILKFPLYYSDRATMFALLLYAAQIARKTQTHRKEPKMSPELLIENLLAYAKCRLFLPEEDEIYMRNVLLSHFRLSSPIRGKRIPPKRKTPTYPTRS